jgi:hypothetical protein
MNVATKLGPSDKTTGEPKYQVIKIKLREPAKVVAPVKPAKQEKVPKMRRRRAPRAVAALTPAPSVSPQEPPTTATPANQPQATPGVPFNPAFASDLTDSTGASSSAEPTKAHHRRRQRNATPTPA